MTLAMVMVVVVVVEATHLAAGEEVIVVEVMGLPQGVTIALSVAALATGPVSVPLLEAVAVAVAVVGCLPALGLVVAVVVVVVAAGVGTVLEERIAIVTVILMTIGMMGADMGTETVSTAGTVGTLLVLECATDMPVIGTCLAGIVLLTGTGHWTVTLRMAMAKKEAMKERYHEAVVAMIGMCREAPVAMKGRDHEGPAGMKGRGHGQVAAVIGMEEEEEGRHAMKEVVIGIGLGPMTVPAGEDALQLTMIATDLCYL